MASPPPLIFAPGRRRAVRCRMRALQCRRNAPRYVIDDMIEDVRERLAFLRVAPRRALVIGAAELAFPGAEIIAADPADGFDEAQPYPFAGFDLIVSLATLDTVNDLPGALIHLRNALAEGGLLLASFCGAGSLPALRAAMFAADGDRPAPRLHPQVDVRAGAGLLQRAGFADPVADHRALEVRFAALDRLVADLRAQGLSNVLARAGPPLTRKTLGQARAAFGERTIETFEIVTLSGWRT